MADYSLQDGRVWFQEKKFVPYKLLLPYGMTDLSDPSGSLNAVRQPAAGQRRATVVTDILRGEPALPGFSLNTRLRKTLNYMLGLNKANFQAHLGACGRPDRFHASEIGLQFERALKGDVAINSVALLQGDDSPVELTVPWMSQGGPYAADFSVELLSARSIAETEAISDMAFIVDACDDVSVQYDPGDNGYLVTLVLGGSPTDTAAVWYTADAGESWAWTSDPAPFAAAENISSVVVLGDKTNHRVIVSRGTADGSNPAEIAYADVTTMGTVTWVTVNVGSVNGQYINYMYWQDWGHLYAITNDGYVYRSDDGGASWTAKLTSGVVSLNEVSALRDGTVWVGGSSNTVYLSDDFGDSWTVKTGPTAGAGDNIDTIHVTPDGTVFIGNDAGEIFGSYDDAISWTTLALQGIVPTAVRRIRGSDDTNIWVAASVSGPLGRILRSVDGGASFTLWSLNIPTNAGLNALAVIDLNYVFTAGNPVSGVAFVTKTNPQIIGL